MASAAPRTPPGAIGFAALVLLCAGAGFFAVVGGDYLLRSYEQAAPATAPQRAEPVSDAAPLAFAALPDLPPLASAPKARPARKLQRRHWRYVHHRRRAAADRTAEYAADAAITKRLNETAKARFDARDGR